MTEGSDTIHLFFTDVVTYDLSYRAGGGRARRMPRIGGFEGGSMITPPLASAEFRFSSISDAVQGRGRITSWNLMPNR